MSSFILLAEEISLVCHQSGIDSLDCLEEHQKRNADVYQQRIHMNNVYRLFYDAQESIKTEESREKHYSVKEEGLSHSKWKC